MVMTKCLHFIYSEAFFVHTETKQNLNMAENQPALSQVLSDSLWMLFTCVYKYLYLIDSDPATFKYRIYCIVLFVCLFLLLNVTHIRD